MCRVHFGAAGGGGGVARGGGVGYFSGMLRLGRPRLDDVRALVRLAVPIVTVQVGLMLMAVVDTMVVGHVSARELAASSLGNLYFYGVGGFGMGIVWAIDPVVSQALGAQDKEAAALGIQRGLVVAEIVGLLLTLLCLPAGAVFTALRQPAGVVPRAAAFVHVSAASVAALLVFVGLRQGLQAMKQTRAIVGTIVAGNVLNLGLNLVFVFGRFGLPAMGAVGAAWSSVLSRYAMIAILLVSARRELAPVLRPWRPAALARGPLLRTVALGLPIGMQISVEFLTFAAISVFAGWFGADAIGGHQVALNLSSLTFMVPMGVGSAASVLVGRSIGAGDGLQARRFAAAALGCGAGFMALSAIVLRAIPGLFAHAYTSVPGVVAVAAALIPIAGVFQVFDGVQVVSAGVLRGAGDTRASLLAMLLGFWLVGTPVSLWLGFRAGLGIVGLWWGFVAGLAAVALFLVGRVSVLLSRPVARVHVDAGPGPGA